MEEVPADNQRRAELEAMVDAFRYFQPLSSDLVPADSLLREFIGGGSYHY